MTGSSGFLGRTLALRLKDQKPDWTIWRLSREEKRSLPDYFEATLEETDKLAKEIRDRQPDIIFHLAGSARISENLSYEHYFRANTRSTQKLITALSRSRSRAKLFYASSIHVYGNQTGTIEESSPLQPTHAYAHTKFLSEKLLATAVRKGALASAVVGRLCNCIGPLQPEGFVLSDTCQRLRTLDAGNKLRMGRLDSVRDFLDVRDAAEIVFRLMTKANLPSYDVFNIGTGETVPLQRAVEGLIEASKKAVELETSQSLSANQFTGLQISIKKLESVIGQPSFRPLSKSLKDIWQQRRQGENHVH